MGVIINDGWLNLVSGSDSFLLAFKQCKADWKVEPSIKHYAGKSHMGYHMGKQYFVWKIKDIIFSSHTDLSNFMQYIDDWENSGPFYLRVIRNSSTNYIEFDGVNTSYTVMVAKGGIKGIEKIAPGDGDVYKIGMLVLEQAG